MYLGIDLGTTNSVIAAMSGTQIRICKNELGVDFLPSVIYIDKRGHKLYGQRAYDQTFLSPENVASGFKRLMGTSTYIEFKASGIKMTAEECSAEILRQLVSQYHLAIGAEEYKGTVITIPAAFNQMQSEATLRAAGMASLDKIALLQEPVAASMAAMAKGDLKDGLFLIYDLGGGTFDLALAQNLGGSISIIAHEGVNMLGGRDFDQILVKNLLVPWLADKFILPENFHKHEKYRRLLRVAQLAAEKAKIELSTKESAIAFASDDEIRIQDEKGQEIYLEVYINREDNDRFLRKDVERTITLAQKMLDTAGYATDDINKIVFIGGPTMMPIIRTEVPRQLGIQVDLSIDPMTAVAQGAAIYCESRDWSDAVSSRKAVRASTEIKGTLTVKMDYAARTADQKARIRINAAGVDRHTLQINSSTGWLSGQIDIADKMTIEVPLSTLGEHLLQLHVFDKNGKPVQDSHAVFTITRTAASIIGIPATQSISVKVRDLHNPQKNTLVPLIKKGTILPAKGAESFLAGKALKYGDKSDAITFEIYQDEGIPDPELNLCIGVFKVDGDDLEHGLKINTGDEIIFHWNMSDSGLLSATVEIPSVHQCFDTPKFYVAQAGHQDFDLTRGLILAHGVLDAVEKAFMETKELLGADEFGALNDMHEVLHVQRERLNEATESDNVRSILENVRLVRQDMARLQSIPSNQQKILRQLIKVEVERFSAYREKAIAQVVTRFDLHWQHANRYLLSGDEQSLRDCREHLNELMSITYGQLFNDPNFLLEIFKELAERTNLIADTAEHQKQVLRGHKAITDNDVQELRATIWELRQLRVSINGHLNEASNLASIMRK